MKSRWSNPTKVPRAELVINFITRSIEMIDNGRAPSKSPREFINAKIKPLLKNCNVKVIVISKQKHGLILSHPKARQPISFGGDQGLHIILRIKDND